ncbi:hypothetical protein DICVIV_00728 [Dictyocaulus viviparus]|uniref:Uncharacterized protein n=1 Tax=Dictyocaulus viviparus TaxID=29172 RepID=A0A0D8Y858_DICVI|nr:hypothetical protein DICVIV_00728 [Dictyocaulus viviparus]
MSSWLTLLLEQNSFDPRVRLELGQQLLNRLLQNQRLPSDSKILNDYCDMVFQWLSGSNFKIGRQNGSGLIGNQIYLIKTKEEINENYS